MPILPGKNLASSLSSSSAKVGHAQNFSATNLGRESIKDARVSTNQVARAKAGKEYSPGTTSISHVGEEKRKATSTAHSAGTTKRSVSDEEEYDEVRDRIRYQHIREMAKAKRDAAGEQSVYDVGIKTGGDFRTRGRKSIKRRLANLYKTAPASYKNISKKDREYFQGVVGKNAKKVSTGSGYSRLAKRRMKLKFEQDRRKGVISYEDAKDMKRMVDQMPKQTRLLQ